MQSISIISSILIKTTYYRPLQISHQTNIHILYNLLPENTPHNPFTRINPPLQLTLLNLLHELLLQNFILLRHRRNEDLIFYGLKEILSQDFCAAFDCMGYDACFATVGFDDTKQGGVACDIG